MDKIKYVKLEQEDGSYSEAIPLAVDSNYIDINGHPLSEVIGEKADAETVSKRIEDLSDAVNLASSRIDNLVHLEEGSTTGDAELIDIRIGENGHEYENGGSSVRGQIGILKDEINFIDGRLELSNIISLYDYQWVDNNTAPTVGTYAKCAHTSRFPLEKGDIIITKPGFKCSLFELSPSDNLYHRWIIPENYTFIITESSNDYFMNLAYTPEANIPDLSALTEGYYIYRKNYGKLWDIDKNKSELDNNINNISYSLPNYIKGLEKKERDLLKHILTNAVFINDVSDDILNFINALAPKTELVVAKENSYISDTDGGTTESNEMSTLKTYHFKEPVNKFSIFVKTENNPIRNILLLLDENDAIIGFWAMNNNGRYNAIFTSNTKYLVYGFKLSVYNDFIDEDYAYETESGQIIFAGKNSIYYNKNNINEK